MSVASIKIDWNEWRRRYADLSDEDQKAVLDLLEIAYPSQKHFDLEAVKAIGLRGSVLEIGGWKGELASEILFQNKEISGWTNIELCSRAVRLSVCSDPRFTAVEPLAFRWYKNFNFKYDALIMSHVIEHFSDDDLVMLLIRVLSEIPIIYIDSPISEDQENVWADYEGTHILKMDWKKIEAIFEIADYDVERIGSKRIFKCRKRVSGN